MSASERLEWFRGDGTPVRCDSRGRVVFDDKRRSDKARRRRRIVLDRIKLAGAGGLSKTELLVHCAKYYLDPILVELVDDGLVKTRVWPRTRYRPRSMYHATLKAWFVESP